MMGFRNCDHIIPANKKKFVGLLVSQRDKSQVCQPANKAPLDAIIPRHSFHLFLR